MVEIQKIEKNLWYVCTRNEYTGDYPDGDLTFKEGFAYKGEDILKEYSEDEIQKYYLRSFRLWTVQDAKPGDFLTYSSEDNKDWYLIYHSEYVPYENHYHYYACYTDKFYTGGTACIDADYLHPSTSKERNILLHKIEEAGYCWDAENLKLTKTAEELTHSEVAKTSNQDDPTKKDLEQKSAEEFCKEAERIMHNIIQYVSFTKGRVSVAKSCYTEAQEWLKSLRSRSRSKSNEDSISEDLEKEIDRWSQEHCYNKSEKPVFAAVARHFAKWQKEIDKLIFYNDLSEFEDIKKLVVNEIASINTIEAIDTDFDGWYNRLIVFAKRCAQWQKQQMLAKAIDAHIELGPNNNHVLMNGIFNKYEWNDKVKIIIIEEDKI